jgi:hypothetical protein
MAQRFAMLITSKENGDQGGEYYVLVDVHPRFSRDLSNVNRQLSSDKGPKPDYDSISRRLQGAAKHV